jgi:hypothetical protein
MIEFKWRKVSGHNKWGAYLEGKHVATVLNYDNRWRLWVDGGNGMQEVNSEYGFGICTAGHMKALAHDAYVELCAQIASGQK